MIQDYNMIRYMESPFRDWKFMGWCLNSSNVKFGVEGIDNNDYITVFYKGYSNIIESDDADKETISIKNGLYGIVLYYGSDNTSYMIRHKQQKLMRGQIDLSEFTNDTLSKSFYYNS